MKIHALASQPHYKEHIEAVWMMLPAALKGSSRWGKESNDKGWDDEDLVMVAGFSDIGRVHRCRMIYVEHGAGQSYTDVRESRRGYYHGDEHDPRVVLYLSPRQAVADSWGPPAVACGSPVCDPYPLASPLAQPSAVISFHWPGDLICPEAGTAFEHYADRLPDIVNEVRRQGFQVYGHAHPKNAPFMRQMWAKIGVDYATVEWVRTNADLLICDNSSLMYEMSYLKRTVIALNAPWFRRDVEHGLRFWDWHGPAANDPDQLMSMPFHDWARSARHNNGGARDATEAYDKPHSLGGDGARAATWLTIQAARM